MRNWLSDSVSMRRVLDLMLFQCYVGRDAGYSSFRFKECRGLRCHLK